MIWHVARVAAGHEGELEALLNANGDAEHEFLPLANGDLLVIWATQAPVDPAASDSVSA